MYNQANADRATQVNTANVGNTIGVNSRNTGLRQDANTQNQNTTTQTRAQDMQRDAGYRGDMLGASGQASATTMSREQIRQYEAEAKARRDAQRFNQQMAVVSAVATGAQTLATGGKKPA
jgi:hypothetical protein